MSTKAVLNFIDAVIQHFPPFRWDEEQEKSWVGTMVKELGSFSDEILDKTVADMIRTRKDRKIPLVSECIGACLETRRWMENEKRASDLPLRPGAGPHLDWSSDRLKLAYDLLRTEMGRQADREGWIGCMFNFCRINSRLPKGDEIALCKKQAKEADEAGRQCFAGGFPQAQTLSRLWGFMLEKREKYGAIARGEVR